MTRRTTHIDRRALFSSAAAAALLAATGVSAAGAPRQGGRLRVALSGAVRSDSWLAGDGLFMQVARQGVVFDTLTEVAADGTLRAELATGWRTVDDARNWVFDLRADVPFHDGALLSARDVVASLTPRLAGRIEAVGDAQVRIMLNAPSASLPMLLSGPDFVIRPAHAPDSGIGTGLYRVKDFVPGQRLLATRVPAHYKDGQAGWFDAVELTSIPRQDVRGQALREYLVDVAELSDAALVQGMPDVTLMPDERRPSYAVLTDVAQPAQISQLRPIDNLRGPERWWFARG